MVLTLERIYGTFFSAGENKIVFLEKLAFIVEKEFNAQERDFLVECVASNIDLEALELALRNKTKNNILSFVVLRLSALAETIPENQSLFINKRTLGTYGVLRYLFRTVATFLLLNLKAMFFYGHIIGKYPNA